MKWLLILMVFTSRNSHAAAGLASGVSCGNNAITWNGTVYTCTDTVIGTVSPGGIDLSTVTTAFSVKASTGVNNDITQLAASVQLSTTTHAWGDDLKSLTLAQLQVIVPISGRQFYCSNCSPKKVVVGTGTSAGNWADPAGGTFK